MLSPLTGILGPLGMKRGGSTTPTLTETANLLTWLEAEFDAFQTSGGSAATADGHTVGELQDQSGNNKHATQTVAGSRPTYRLDGNGIGGKPALEFDGTADNFSISLSSTSGAYSAYWVIDPDVQSAISYLYDIQTGRLVFANRTSNNTSVGWFDGAFHNIAASSTNAQILTILLGSGTGEVYRDNVLLGSDSYTSKDIGSAQRLCTGFDGSAGFYKGKWGAMLFYSVKHNSTQRTSVATYLSQRYGISI